MFSTLNAKKPMMKLVALCLFVAAATAAAASTRGQQIKAVNAAGVVAAPPNAVVNAQLQKAAAAEHASDEDDSDIHSHMHSDGHAFKSGKGCGHSVPHFSRALREAQEAAPNSPLETITDAHGRRTQSLFKPAAQAVIDGDGGPIRIAVSCLSGWLGLGVRVFSLHTVVSGLVLQ